MNTPNHCTDDTINQLWEGVTPLVPKLNAETLANGRTNDLESAKVIELFLGCTKRQPVLRVGDQVMWRHGWGADPARPARIKRIEIDCNSLAENGETVQECSWDRARMGSTVVDLDNGHWAYGDQIEPL